MDPVVILGSESVSVGPGQEHRLPVRIRNQGRRVESFRVDIVGAPGAFAEVVPLVVSVLPGREAEIDVIFRPPGGASTPTGTLPFAVRATSEVDASSSAVAEGRLELAGIAGLQAWAPETSRAGRWSARYHVEFANQGNAAVRLALTAHDPAGITKLRLSPDVIDLPPGGRATAQLKSTTRRPFLRGSKANRNLQVACQTFPFGVERPAPGAPPPQGDPNHRTFQLTFEQRPILPKFAIPLLVLVLAALIALAVLKLRQGEEFALDLAAPLSPNGFLAVSSAESTIGLQWDRVPNAEGYEIRQLTPAERVVEPLLPPDQLSYRVEGLEPNTEYCFAIKALGPESDSALSEQKCETTSPLTELTPPTDVLATPLGEDRYEITWTPPAGFEGALEFVILLDGVPTEGLLPTPPVSITILPGAAERNARIEVQAIRDTEKSDPSVAYFVPIPALPPETVPPTPPPTESPATTAAPETTAAATTVPGGQPTDTGPPSTEPSPTADALHNLTPTWVAMLGVAPPASQGGEALAQRLEEVSERSGVPVADLRVFSNRDTFSQDTDGSPSIQQERGFAAARNIYVAKADPSQAETVCSTSGDCTVLQLTGAALASETRPILILKFLPPEVSMPDVDQQLDDFRSADGLNTRDVHVLNGSDYPQLRTTSPVVFVRGFTTAAEVQSFCDAKAISPCTITTLERSG